MAVSISFCERELLPHVAEQRRALVLLAHLRRLALRIEAAVTHPAVAAGDVEGDHDAIAGSDVRDRRADRLDNRYRALANGA
jgi:hypothetical protein